MGDKLTGNVWLKIVKEIISAQPKSQKLSTRLNGKLLKGTAANLLALQTIYSVTFQDCA